MKTKGQLRRLFCLGVAAGAVADEQEEAVKAAAELHRRKQPKLHVKILRSVSSLKRSRSADSSRSLPSSAKHADDGEYRRPMAVLTSSASGSSSSDTSPASTSSSISFQSSASSNSTPVKRKSSPAPAPALKPKPKRANYNTAITGLCMLLLSLSVMVFGGRLCAILWTSTWLFLVPGRKAIAAAAPHSDARARCSDEGEKKRIVLEGLLERNRRVGGGK